MAFDGRRSVRRGRVTRRVVVVSVAVAIGVVSLTVRAQDRPAAAPASADPRVGLKPGFKDAGQAASSLRLVASLPKPNGFFDRKSPAGDPIPPETPEKESPDGDEAAKEKDAAPAAEATPAKEGAPVSETPPAGQAPGKGEAPEKAAPAAGAHMLDFANSDLAFSGNHLFVGSFHGFNIYDLANPHKPKLIASVVCPGGQGDVSVHGNLLVMSVEQTRGRLDCGTQGVQATVSPDRFRGVRVFDISNVKRPRQVAAVQTCRGSHTHTLVAPPGDTDNIYVYGSGISTVRSAEELAECSGKDPKDDPNTALFSIDVIKIPIASPEKAAIVNRPRIFADPKTGAIAGLWPGGAHGPGTQKTSVTNQCHDITVLPQAGLAAGACSGNGILLDISDPVHPVRLDQVTDDNFAYWHSATFNNDGTKVIFTDEWGGGTRPRCRATDPPNWGADAIFDIVDRKLRFAGYYKLPVPQTEQENCVAHNGSLVPVPGRDIFAQAWYQGGISVVDFTDAAHPVEIAYFDRGPLDAKQLMMGGYWSAYWYNGRIYGTEIARGIDVFELTPGEHLTKHEIDAAAGVRMTVFNAQQQPRVTWTPSPVVARAYLDQLARSRGINPARATPVNGLLERVEKARGGKDKSASELVSQIDGLVAQLKTDAGAASGRDAARLKALAETLDAQGARLRTATN